VAGVDTALADGRLDRVAPQLAQALARPRWRLRFEPELEAAFQADTFEARRRLLTVMALAGLLGVWLVTRRDAMLMPDLVHRLPTFHAFTLWGGVISLLVVWAVSLVGPRGRQAWLFDAATAVNATGFGFILMVQAVLSRTDAAQTHTNVLAGVLLFNGIACRLRFHWAALSTVFIVAAHGLWVHGHTPLQAMVVEANTTLLVMVAAFTLLLNHAFEHAERRQWLLRRLEWAQASLLQADADRLHRLSGEDPLTGLANRRRFDAALQLAWEQALARRHSVSLLLVDVDHFKAYNDAHGHPEGDACLRQLGLVLDAHARRHQGLAARLGGEEFVLLLPARQAAAAATIGQDLCEAVAALQRPHADSPVGPHVTISVGVAGVQPRRQMAVAQLVQAADAALYQAKHAGRNRVCLSPGLAVQPDAPVNAQAAWPPQRSLLIHPADAGMGDATQARTLQRLQSLLDKGLWRLRFAPALEADYQADRSPERRLHVRWSALIGLCLFNGYLVGSVPQFPDVPLAALWALALLSACMVTLVVTASLVGLTPRQREVTYSLAISVMAVASSWLLSLSQAPTVWSFMSCLLLLPLFAGAGARLPFRWALPPALVNIAAMVACFAPPTPETRLIYQDSLLNVVSATLYPLVAAYALEHAERKQWLLGRIASLQHAALQQLRSQLAELSLTDALTHLPNRRQFEAQFAPTLHEALVTRLQLVVMVIDVDHFKRYNDALGHPAGDACLQAIATQLRQLAQAQGAHLCRLGGEEFGWMQLVERHQVAALGDAVLGAVRSLQLPHPDGAQRGQPVVSVSIGVSARLAAPSDTLISHLAPADEALYAAKRAGRDRVVMVGEVPPVAPTPKVACPSSA